MLGYITFIILTYIAGSGVEDFDQRFIAVGKNCLTFLCTAIITCLMFSFVPIIYIIYKARRKQLVLEDGIENVIDSPPKYCVEESPPPYEEAVTTERKAIFSNAEISNIL